MSNSQRRWSGASLHHATYLIAGLAVVCLVTVLGLASLFESMREDLTAKSANERARLFVGEEIVRGIQDIEKSMYRMAATTGEHGLARVRSIIDQQLQTLRQNLGVLKNGGVVRRQIRLNIEGHDEMIREAVYRPEADAQGYVMELIEIAPLLDQVPEKAGELQALIGMRDVCLTHQDSKCLTKAVSDIAIFLKQLPPYFERVDENANRLFFDSNERLRLLEEELQTRIRRLRTVELLLVALVLVLAGGISSLLLLQINRTNRQLADALKETEAARDHAEYASRAKSEFVSRMSHELRTPLNAIIGFADLLMAEPLSSSHRNYVNMINSSGRHLMELINAVLDLAKIEAGGMTLEQVPLDFAATIDDVKTLIAGRARDKGLDFVANVAPNLPHYIVGDPTRLRQVLINLLANAIKFTERGSVELRMAREADRIVFSIRDSGIGMSQEALGQLFRPFSQADSSITRRYGGTGLGMSISKDLIQAMGGGIEVDSAPGAGTCCWVWLPLREADAPATQAVTSTQAEATDAVAIDRLIPGRVLIVDDNAVNQQLAGAMLAKFGLAYDIAQDGVEALRRLEASPYALVLMDMEMPQMDGITATMHIREREQSAGGARLPIVAMTANALQEDRERCFAAGMDGYLAKPISRKSLEDELRRVFGNSAHANMQTPVTEAGSGTTRVVDREQASPIFDLAVVLDRLGGDEQLLRKMAGMLVTRMPRMLEDMEAALAANDKAALKRAAHTLKSLFATFASVRGEKNARQLEQDADGGDAESKTMLVARIRDAAGELNQALTKYVEAAPATP